MPLLSTINPKGSDPDLNLRLNSERQASNRLIHGTKLILIIYKNTVRRLRRRRRRRHHHHHHIAFMELGHFLTRSGLTYLEVSSKVYHDSFCQLGSSIMGSDA